ncbi:MAG TPA: hypothetical protein DIU00_13680 [Phycisphaerales bacterium]|nr:hypothetical protein [Phycisphaerales bacterium]
MREQIAYQDTFYQRPEFRWACSCYSCCFLMMCGNVWEWTESDRSDGLTRFCIVRGGSFFKAEGSSWYADGGPRSRYSRKGLGTLFTPPSPKTSSDQAIDDHLIFI